MSYYWFNRQEILQNAKKKKKILKKKLLSIILYYNTSIKKQRSNKRKSTERYKILSQVEKDKIKEYQKDDINIRFSTKKKGYKINEHCFCLV